MRYAMVHVLECLDHHAHGHRVAIAGSISKTTSSSLSVDSVEASVLAQLRTRLREEPSSRHSQGTQPSPLTRHLLAHSLTLLRGLARLIAPQSCVFCWAVL
jgi:hypothetical protein